MGLACLQSSRLQEWNDLVVVCNIESMAACKFPHLSQFGGRHGISRFWLDQNGKQRLRMSSAPMNIFLANTRQD